MNLGKEPEASVADRLAALESMIADISGKVDCIFEWQKEAAWGKDRMAAMASPHGRDLSSQGASYEPRPTR